MAQNEKTLTWKEKLEQGVPLSPLDEVKADADFNFKRRLREKEEEAEFERLKNRSAEAAEPKTKKETK